MTVMFTYQCLLFCTFSHLVKPPLPQGTTSVTVPSVGLQQCQWSCLGASRSAGDRCHDMSSVVALFLVTLPLENSSLEYVC